VRYPRTLAAIIIIGCLALAAYIFRGPLKIFFSPPSRADATTISRALDSVYAEIEPRNVTAGAVNLDGRVMRRDHVLLGGDQSILRANLAITRAVENAGGKVLYGVDSSDGRRGREVVVLGISDGDSLLREINLEHRRR
jgi:hypothetical protein